MDGQTVSAPDVPIGLLTDSAPPTPFRWTRLNYQRREFRLLELHGTVLSEGEDRSIRASMHTVPLNVCPAYDALSYCWGSRVSAKKIAIDGHPHPITENLHEALTVLLSRQVQYLWVDALCINQDDPDEKGAQVQRMATIFQEAQKVIAWLGPARDSTKWTFLLLKRRAIRDPSGGGSRTFWGERFLKEIAPLTHTHRSSQPFLAFEDALQDILDREYWRRLWVVQELAVATRIELFCGVHSLEGRVFELLFSSRDWAFKRLGASKTWGTSSFNLFEHLVNIWSIRALVRQRKPVDLLTLLFRLRQCMTTEIVDRIFAITGLAYDQRTFIAEPDYTLQGSQLDFLMTKRLIQSSTSLDILLLSPGDTAQNSWYCAFSKINIISTISAGGVQAVIDYINGNIPVLRCGINGPTWRTTEPPMTGDVPFLISGDALTVKGVRLQGSCQPCTRIDPTTLSSGATRNFNWFTSLCRILLTTSAFHGNENCALSLKNQLLFRLRKHVDGQIHHGLMRKLNIAEPADAELSTWNSAYRGGLFKQFLKGALPDQQYAELDAAETLMWKFIKQCSLVVQLAEWGPQDQQHTEEQQAAAGLEADQGKAAEVYDHAVKSATLFENEYARCFFAIDAQSIGMTAKVGGQIRDDDEIWILNRCSIPLVLRRVPGTASQYTLVNYAIIDTVIVNGKRCNVMDGEAWSTAKKEEFEYVDLV